MWMGQLLWGQLSNASEDSYRLQTNLLQLLDAWVHSSRRTETRVHSSSSFQQLRVACGPSMAGERWGDGDERIAQIKQSKPLATVSWISLTQTKLKCSMKSIQDYRSAQANHHDRKQRRVCTGLGGAFLPGSSWQGWWTGLGRHTHADCIEPMGYSPTDGKM